MIPTYPYSQQSSSFSPPMPIDLNIEDQSHDLIFSPTYQPSSSSNSTLSSSYPILFNPSHHDHAGSSSYYCQLNHFRTHEHLQGEKIVGARGSWDDPAADNKEGEGKRGLKLKVWKKGSDDEDNKKEDHQNQKNNNHESHEDNYIIDDSVKWMPSKMRMMRKMMANSVSDQKGHKFEDQTHSQKQQPLILMSPLGTDNSSSNSSSNNITVVRVCADCHTTKTPLWRSGPRGPKSLCNACGIRQRKARRAMAAAAMAANGPAAIAMETSRGYKIERKEKKSKMECEGERDLKKNKKKKKKKRKLVGEGKAIGRGRKKFGFDLEDLAVRLSKKLGPLSQVFPQDEKEAAILLMALSYNYNGLLHG